MPFKVFLAGYPAIRPAGYPANETGYPAGYRLSKKAGYPASRISGATLIITLLIVKNAMVNIH